MSCTPTTSCHTALLHPIRIPTHPYLNSSLPQPIPTPPTCCRSRWSSKEHLTLDAVPAGFGINEKTYAITSFQKHTCAFEGVTATDKPVTLTLKQRTGWRSMTSKQLSLVVRDEYYRAARSGQPWNLRSPTQHPHPTQSAFHAIPCEPVPPHPVPACATPSIVPTCANPRNLRACREAILVHDEGAANLAGSVLQRLKGLHLLPKESEMELIQGYVRLLRRMGFGAALHTALGSAVKHQVPLTCSPSHSFISISHP